MRSKYYRLCLYFSVEQFLRPSIIGVDIELSEVRIAEVAKRGEKYILVSHALSAVENNDPTHSLRKLLIQNGSRGRDFALGVASPDLVIHPFRFPKMPKKETW